VPFLVWAAAKPILYLSPLFWIVAAIVGFVESSRKSTGRERGSVALLIASAFANALFAFWFGPYVVGPCVAVLTSILPIVAVRDFRNRVTLVCALGSIVLPAALAWFGVLPPFYTLDHGSMIYVTHFENLTRTSAEAILLVSNAAIVFAAVNAAIFVRRELNRAQDAV